MLSFCPVVLCLALSPSLRLHETERALLQEQRFEEACTLLRSALDHDPSDVEAWSLLGHALLGEADGLPVTSEEEWQRAEEQYQLAEQSFRQGIDIEPDRPQLWNGLAEALQRMGRSEETIATLYHSLSLDDSSLSTRIQLAGALMAARDFDLENQSFDQASARLEEAERVLRAGTQSVDRQAELLSRLGDVLFAKGEHDEALTSLRRAITLRPTNLAIHDTLMRVMEASKEFDDTIAFYQGLVDEPALGQWYGSRSHELKGHVAYNVERDYDAAVLEYRNAEAGMFESVHANPEYADSANSQIPLLRSYQGYAHMRAGHLEQAEAAFLAALDRQPGLANARDGLRSLLDEYWTRMGGEGATKEDFDRIRSFAARLCVAIPDDANCWNNYGFFARESGRYEESYQAYRRSMSLAPDNPRIINDTALILVYHLHRDLDLAADWLWEARDLAEEQRVAAADSEDRQLIAAAEETYGDTLVNLVVLYHQRGDLEHAREVLNRVKEELPKRHEIAHWHRVLFPDQPLEDTMPPDLQPAATATAPAQEGDSGGE